jgi:hypothetical protein
VNQLRPLEISDIPQIVSLRRRVFTHSSLTSDAALALYYRTLLFENPWYEPRYPSFVQEGSDGEILGFIGAIPRPMLLGAERVTAVTSTELMVAPEARGLVGPKLVRRLFDGGQDLTYSDRSTDQARALYEGLGGSTALWYSLYWTVSLDGSQVSFDATTTEPNPSMAVRALRRAGRLLERLATVSVTRSGLATSDEPLSPEVVIALTRSLAAKNTLVPEYDTHSFSWLLQRLAETQKSARVVTAQVTHNGEPIGWFLYAIQPTGQVDVIQLAALPGRERLTFEHLIYHALVEGGSVVRGRFDRRFASFISERALPLTVGRPWAVVRSGRPDLAAQFLNGNAFFSRLDAEWWIGT